MAASSTKAAADRSASSRRSWNRRSSSTCSIRNWKSRNGMNPVLRRAEFIPLTGPGNSPRGHRASIIYFRESSGTCYQRRPTMRMLRLLAALLVCCLADMVPAMETTAALAPKLVTLKAEKQTLKQVFDDITKQTGYKIEYFPNNQNQTYSFDFSKKPLWQVLDEIDDAAGMTIVQS